jgi:hypothetical protein
MKIKIRKELNDIIDVNETIINALKGQKARQDQLLEKYEQEVMDEINIPSNLQRNWARIMRNYIDSVISGKLMDFEILKKYQEFVKQVVAYESEYILSEGIVKNLEFCSDMSAETVMKLEKRIIDLKEQAKKDKKELQKRIIRTYQKLPQEEKKFGGHCIYCGKKLNPESDNEEECEDCDSIPLEERPFLRKTQPSPQFTAYQEKKRREREGLPTMEEDENLQTGKESEISEEEDTEQSEIVPEDEASEDVEQEEIEEPEVEKKPEGETREDRDFKKDFNKLMDRFEKKYQDELRDEEEVLREIDDE